MYTIRNIPLNDLDSVDIAILVCRTRGLRSYMKTNGILEKGTFTYKDGTNTFIIKDTGFGFLELGWTKDGIMTRWLAELPKKWWLLDTEKMNIKDNNQFTSEFFEFIEDYAEK